MYDYLDPKKSIKPSPKKFCQYFNQLCKNSLITGFPIIATTKNIIRKAIKAFVFLVCLAGFLYQTSDFLGMYLSYPTIVDVGITIPTILEIPAVTVCNKNRIKRKLVCTKEPKICTFFNNREIFCDIYKNLCKPREKEGSIVLAIPDSNKLYDINTTWEYLKEMGFKQKEVVPTCILKNGKVKEKCTGYVDVYASDTKGNPNMCFAVESLWEKPEEKPNVNHTSIKMTLLMMMYPEQYLDPNDKVHCYLSVHDSFSLVNPFTDGIMLEAGKIYNIYIDQVVKLLLPAPYKTNCTDYLKTWKANGGTGPINQKMCAEKCKLELLVNEGMCIDSSVSYPHNETMCRTGVFAITPEIIDKCSDQCQPACKDQTYHTRVEETDDLADMCNEDDHVCPKARLILNFIFSRMEVTKFEHNPKYESVEMFSYIGGYMGMWLGISLVALFDFLETIVYLVYYPCRTKRTKKLKKIRDNNNPRLFYNRYDI